jgi:cell division protein ZapA
MKQVEVSILGQAYMLGCPEGGEALLAAAVASVDREMSTIRDSGKVRARERIAVLAALNLAYILAERGPAPSMSPAIAANGNGNGNGPHIDLDGLLRRVDDALGDDGRLL